MEHLLEVRMKMEELKACWEVELYQLKTQPEDDLRKSEDGDQSR